MAAPGIRTLTQQAIFVVTSVALITSFGLTNGELNLPIRWIDKWATNFGNNIYAVASKATGLTDLQTDYLLMKPSVVPIDGKKLLNDFKRDMQNMLNKKVRAIRRLVNRAETAHKEHLNDEYIKREYPKAKKLNTTEYILMENEHFNYIPVNHSFSTVHVPTNVFDESAEVLNGVDWSEALDPYFKENYEQDNTLTWQYFGSSTGFFRSYPGSKWRTETWEKEKVDIFDCRTRGWYIQAATSPKDIVIMLDVSGSMTGQRLEIAKETVDEIMETLSDDDFFNIIKFSKQPEYLDECFNRTLVQANADNKKRLQEHLRKIKTEEIADYDKALTEAFELLREMNSTGRGTLCNHAIMIITDGAPDNFEEIFRKYNWEEQQNTRIFTYLIGRETSESKQLKWMACANKGFYVHISTLADAQEKVQEYIHVISRPMVIHRAYSTTWTSVYIDAAGLNMMTSVAMPVFDRKNETAFNGNLLGVIGTDVPLKELIKLTPQYKLGVNGYSFAITNNGYILFHPDFRPMKGTMVKPNYNSVDLSEVEIPADEPTSDSGLPIPDYESDLRREMIGRRTGTQKMKVKIHYDEMKRVTIRENNYYYTDVDDTPFSLGIALPAGYGMNYLDGTKELNSDTDLDAFQSSMVKIATWNYCKMETNETRQDRVEMLLKYLEAGKKGSSAYHDKCDKALIESLLFDVVATRGALASWMKENRDGTLNDSSSRSNCTSHICTLGSSSRNGIELVFLGTKAGLTRYYPLVDNLTDPKFMETLNGTIEELYYKRAVEGGESVFTFSVPFSAGEDDEKKGGDFNWTTPNIVLTASSPIIISEEGREAVAAVVGLQMKYEKFFEFFMNSTRNCGHHHRGPRGSRENCNITCESLTLDCYLLDNNGFVVLSETPKDVGKFFGEVDGTLMHELIQQDDLKDPSATKKGVFQRIKIYDYQGMCEIWVTGMSGAASRLFIDPLRNLFSSLSWFVQEVALFLVQFNLYSWWYADYTTVRGNDEDFESIDDMENLIGVILSKLQAMGTDKQFDEWRNQLFSGMFDYNDRDLVLEWFDTIKHHYEPRMEGFQSCINQVPLFKGIPQNLPQYDVLTGCGWCSRSYSIHRVPRTNLMLLAVDALCLCSGYIPEQPVTVKPIKIEYNDSMMCLRLQTDIYRMRPKECHDSHQMEDTTMCGRGSQHSSSVFCILSLLLLSLYAILPRTTFR